MMFKACLSVFLAVVSLVTADPAHLQNQYGAPSVDVAQSSLVDNAESLDSNNQPGGDRFDFPQTVSGENFNPNNQPGGPSFDSSQSGEPSRNNFPAGNPSSNSRGGSYLPPKKYEVPVELAKGLESPPSGEVTVREVITQDVFKTETNLFYNTIPVTLTEFMRSTIVQPTFEVVATPVPDRVSLQKSTVTLTNTVTVTDTSTSFQYPTAVSTDVFTVTHKAYDIQQQVLTSTVIESGVYRPTVVSTKVLSEYQTSTEYVTITNTIFLNAPKQSYIAPEYGAPRGNGISSSQNPQFSVDNQRAIMVSQQIELDLMIRTIIQNDVANLRNSQASDLARRMSQAETAPANVQFSLNQQILNEQNSLMNVVRNDINRQASQRQNFGRNIDSYVQ